MAERQTKVTLTAQVQGYIDGMEKAARKTRDVGTEAEKLAKQKEAFELLGRAGIIVGGAMLATSALAVRAAIQWESAWTGVRKTVEGTDEELARVEQGLRDLTGVLPASHDEIAAVAEAAGQLGVQTGSIVAFTRTMIDLGETTNLTSDEAATSLAQLMNIFQTAPEDVDNLGASVVALGNNGASTERDIVQMAQRIAGAANIIGLTEGETLGLANALASVGVEAEAGGSSVSNIMIDIANAVSSQGPKLLEWSKLAGLGADEFSEKYRTKPAEALTLVIEGMGRLNDAGGDVFGTLTALGQTDVRVTRSLLGLAGAGDDLRNSLELGNRAWEENTALTEEAAKRYETVEAKLSIAANSVNDAAISFGEALAPAVGAAAEKVTELANIAGGLPEWLQGSVAVVGTLTGAVLLSGGAFFLAVPKIAEYRVALETMGPAAQRAGRFVGGLTRVLGGVALAGAAVVAVNELATALADNFGPSAEETANAFRTATTAAEQFQSAMTERYSKDLGLDEANKQLARLGEALDAAEDRAANWFDAPGPILEETLANVRGIGKELGSLAQSDLPAANDQFKRLAAGLDEVQMARLIEEMPEYKAELVKVATEEGKTADASVLLGIALREASNITTEESIPTLSELGGAAGDAQSDIAKLSDELRNFGSVNYEVIEAENQFQQAIYDATESMQGEGFIATMDQATQAGRDNVSALLDVARSTNEYAAAAADAGSTQEEVNAILEAGRTQLYNQAIQFGATEAEAHQYADTLVSTPALVQTAVQLNGVPEAEQALANLLRQRSVDIAVNINGGGLRADVNEAGGFYSGGVRAFESGGFPSGVYAGRSGGIHKFAEESLPWETYISPKPGHEKENIGYALEALGRLGFGGYAGGGSTTTVRQPVEVVVQVDKYATHRAVTEVEMELRY